MIKLTLKELNTCFPALNTVAESLTAGKMKYRFARVLKSAKDHIEIFAVELAALAQKHGAELIGNNRFNFDPEKQKAENIKFNHEAEDWMRNEVVELWGDPIYFTFDEVEAAADPKKPISAATLSELLFLISEKVEDEEKPKAATATA